MLFSKVLSSTFSIVAALLLATQVLNVAAETEYGGTEPGTKPAPGSCNECQHKYGTDCHCIPN